MFIRHVKAAFHTVSQTCNPPEVLSAADGPKSTVLIITDTIKLLKLLKYLKEVDIHMIWL